MLDQKPLVVKSENLAAYDYLKTAVAHRDRNVLIFAAAYLEPHKFSVLTMCLLARPGLRETPQSLAQINDMKAEDVEQILRSAAQNFKQLCEQHDKAALIPADVTKFLEGSLGGAGIAQDREPVNAADPAAAPAPQEGVEGTGAVPAPHAAGDEAGANADPAGAEGPEPEEDAKEPEAPAPLAPDASTPSGSEEFSGQELFIPGQLLYYPGKGVVIAVSKKMLSASGLADQAAWDFRHLDNVNVSIGVPEHKLADRRIREIASREQLEDALRVLNEGVEQPNERFDDVHLRKNTTYNSWLDSADPSDVAKVVGALVYPLKGRDGGLIHLPKPQREHYVQRAIRLLSEELSQVAGITYKAAEVHILTVALGKKGMSLWPPQATQPRSTQLTGEQFHELFGMTIDQSLQLANRTIVVDFSRIKIPGHAGPGLKGYFDKGSSGDIASRTRKAFKAPEKQEIFEAENANVPSRGTHRGAFLFACQELSVEDFRLLALNAFRVASKRLSIAQIAAELSISEDEARHRLNRAALNFVQQAKPKGQSGLARVVDGILTHGDATALPRAVFVPRVQEDFSPLPELKDSYEEERLLVPDKGFVAGVFRDAASVLTEFEFIVYVSHDLRLVDHRKSLQELSEELELSIEEIVTHRNAAVEKINAYRTGQGRTAKNQYAILEPIAVPVDETSEAFLALKAVYDRESALVGPKGIGRGGFEAAYTVFDAWTFEVLSMAFFRSADQRVSLPQIAAQKGLSEREVHTMLSSALERFASHATEINKPGLITKDMAEICPAIGGLRLKRTLKGEAAFAFSPPVDDGAGIAPETLAAPREAPDVIEADDAVVGGDEEAAPEPVEPPVEAVEVPDSGEEPSDEAEIFETINIEGITSNTLAALGNIYLQDSEKRELALYLLGCAAMLDDAREPGLIAQVQDLQTELKIQFDPKVHFTIVEQFIQSRLNEGIEFDVELGFDGFEEPAADREAPEAEFSDLGGGEAFGGRKRRPVTETPAPQFVIPSDAIPPGGALKITVHATGTGDYEIILEPLSPKDVLVSAPARPDPSRG